MPPLEQHLPRSSSHSPLRRRGLLWRAPSIWSIGLLKIIQAQETCSVCIGRSFAAASCLPSCISSEFVTYEIWMLWETPPFPSEVVIRDAGAHQCNRVDFAHDHSLTLVASLCLQRTHRLIRFGLLPVGRPARLKTGLYRLSPKIL